METLTLTEKLVSKTLAAKPFYRPDAGPALVMILDKHCHSDEHRRKVCDTAVTMKFMRGGKMEDCCPGPAELLDIIRDSKPAAREASPGCKMCEGSGFEQIGGGAKRCRCGGVPASAESMMSYHRAEARKNPAAYRQFDGVAQGKSF